MSKTAGRVKNLESFLRRHGDDALIAQTISKMLVYKVRQYEMEIKRLDKELMRLERAHGMNSADFYREFSEGKLGDDMDFVEWSSLYQMRRRLFDKKVELESV
jgi:hypothetical protein